MICKFKFDYQSEAKIKALSPEDYLRLVVAIPGLEPKQEEYSNWRGQTEHYADHETLALLAEFELGISLERNDTGLMVSKLEDRINALELRQAELPRKYASGAAVAIHVPDLSLMKIDEVTWMDDACTQELQRELDKGWRILAVCPPNAQRRPDYILGRRKSHD